MKEILDRAVPYELRWVEGLPTKLPSPRCCPPGSKMIVKVLTSVESDLARKTTDRKRILKSRFVYRDKNCGVRSAEKPFDSQGESATVCGGSERPGLRHRSDQDRRTDGESHVFHGVHAPCDYLLLAGEPVLRRCDSGFLAGSLG